MDLSGLKDDYPVPAQFKKVLPEDLTYHNDTEAYETVTKWLADFQQYVGRRANPERVGSSLVLVGPPGTGKTLLASACMNYIASTHTKTTAFITDDELDRLLRKARYSRLDDEDEWLVGAVENVGFITVDDALRLGGTAEFMEPYLRRRYARAKSTILTLNSGVDVADALASFLSTWTWAVFTGPDQRRV